MLLRSCIQCTQPYQANAEVVGKSIKCPRCGVVQTVPADLAAATLPSAGPGSMQANTLPTESGVPNPVTSASTRGELQDFFTPPQRSDEMGRLGPYRILRALGRGGMGIVYEAEDAALNRRVALKVMLPHVAATGKSRERFQREARAAAAISHDHIIAILQVGEEHGIPFVAMPLLLGEPLNDRLHGQPILPMTEVLRIGREIALGLEAAHTKGLIHRDIKPANIWLETPQDRVKILDFGLARPVGTDTQLTQEGAVVGTPAYMSPEQGRGQSLDGRSDLFSLGCVLYRMATGRQPFHGPDAVAMLLAVQMDQPRAPGDVNPDVPPELSDLIMTLLAKDPAQRPASARIVAEKLGEMERDATAIIHLDTIRARKIKQKKRRHLAMVSIGLLGGLLAAMVVLFLTNRNGEPIEKPEEKPANNQRPPVAISTGEPISSVALTPAPGKLKGARSWTIETRGPRRLVSALAMPPVRGPLAVGSRDGMVRLHEALNGDLIRVLPGHSGPITAFAWSPDGRRLASGSEDKTIRLWDIASGRTTKMLQGFTGPIRGVSWSPDGKTLAAAVAGRKVWLWDVDKEQELPPLEAPDQSLVAVAWSPKGTRLATAWDRVTRIWDVSTGKIVQTLPKSQGPIPFWCPWSADGQRLAFQDRFNSNEATIAVWDVETAKEVKHWTAHGWHTYAVAWSLDGYRFASTGHDNVVKTWDSTGTRLGNWAIEGAGGPPRLTWSHDSKRLMNGTGLAHDRVECRDPTTGILVWEIMGHAVGADSTALSPDGTTLAAVHNGTGSVRLWDLKSGQIKAVWEGFVAQVFHVAWSPDGQFLVASTRNQPVRVWDVNKRQVVRSLEFEARVDHISWSPDSKYVAGSAEETKAAYIFEVSTGKRVARLEGNPLLFGLHWSPDGKSVAATHDVKRGQGIVQVWDVASGQIRTFNGHRNEIKTTAFAPRSNLLASGSQDSTVRLWNLDTGKQHSLLEGHKKAVTALAWSSDGKTLASGSEDETVSLWPLDEGNKPVVLAEKAGRVEVLAWSPEGQRIAVLSGQHVSVWEKEGRRLHSWRVDRGDNCTLHWLPDGKALVSGRGDGTSVTFDTTTGKRLATLLNLRNGQGIALSPEGHFMGRPEIERSLVYVVETEKGQETLSATEFRDRFCWHNDPSRVVVMAP